MNFRGLADMNADGKMDKKEFSIAVYLIQKKLKGIELPKVLPPSLKEDPVGGGMGALGGLAGLNMGAPAPSPIVMGGSATLPPGKIVMILHTFSCLKNQLQLLSYS